MDARLIMSVKNMQDRSKWLELRKKGIGGSEAATIMGYSPWSSPWALWMEKTGQAEPRDISDNPVVRAGVYLEPVVAKWFEDETGFKVERRGMMQNKKYPWLLANVDRIIPARKNHFDEDVGLEIKTTSPWSAKEWDDHGVPDNYYLQCCHYMMVTGLKAWYIAVLIGGQDFRYELITRNKIVEAQIKELFQAEKEFWTVNVKRGIQPKLDSSEATSQALKRKYPGGQEEPIDLPEEYAANAVAWMRAKEDEKKSAANRRLNENILKEAMKDNEHAYLGRYWEASWKSQKGRTTFDTKRFKADHPDLYEEYVKHSDPVRVFKISARRDEK